MSNATTSKTSHHERNLGGVFTFPGTRFTVNRMGYGAMQLPGPGVWGPPRDRFDEAIAVLHEAVESGVNHIDTADFYGPHVSNQLIREALHPYRDGLVIVTKVGARRDDNKGWHGALSRQELIDAIHDNLRNLGMDSLHVVNLRIHPAMGNTPEIVAEPFTVLADLQQKGLIQHLGVSAMSAAQLAAAQRIAPVVCVQNLYNVAHREDDAFIDSLAQQGIAYVPFFPLGGFSPLQSSALSMTSQHPSTPRPCRSRSPGCSTARPTCCSSPARPHAGTCVKTCRPSRSNSLRMCSPNSMRSTPRWNGSPLTHSYKSHAPHGPSAVHASMLRISWPLWLPRLIQHLHSSRRPKILPTSCSTHTTFFSGVTSTNCGP